MRRTGARTLILSASQSAAGSRLVGGPVRLWGFQMSGGQAAQGLTVDQSVAAPAAGAHVATIMLPNGSYQVEWTLEIEAAGAAADLDNVQVFISATQVATSVNAGAVGTYQQEEISVTVTGGPLTLAFSAAGAASAGSVYKVEANITQVSDSQATIFDGGGQVAFSDIAPGRVDSRWFGDIGLCVDTELRVLATAGAITGVLWYSLESEVGGWEK